MMDLIFSGTGGIVMFAGGLFIILMTFKFFSLVELNKRSSGHYLQRV
jgi:hypothetical protein